VPVDLDHPSLRTAAATAAAYGLILLGILLVVFLLPYAAFGAL